jgi:hypothetical protein
MILLRDDRLDTLDFDLEIVSCVVGSYPVAATANGVRISGSGKYALL